MYVYTCMHMCGYVYVCAASVKYKCICYANMCIACEHCQIINSYCIYLVSVITPNQTYISQK